MNDGDRDREGDVVLPCAGLSVVEVAVGTSDLGLGLVAGVPGMILADLGASVTRVVGAAPDIDAHVPWGRAWHRDKELVTEEDAARTRRASARRTWPWSTGTRPASRAAGSVRST